MYSKILALALLLCATALPATSPADTAIIAEAKAADAALIAAQSRNDLKAMAEMIADDYAYIDVSGNRVGKAKLLSRREGDKLSLSEMIDSEEEAIVLSPVTVLLRGKSAGTALYFGGLPRKGATRWSAIWRKESDGRWRVVAEQTTVIDEGGPKKVRTTLNPADVAAHAGSWTLATRTPMTMVLVAEGDTLKASIAGQFTDMIFLPESPGVFFNTLRPFALHFATDGKSLNLITWSETTAGTRAAKP